MALDSTPFTASRFVADPGFSPRPVLTRPDVPRRNTAGVRPRGGAHRLPAPPHALKGRAAVVAVAAGAVVSAGQTAIQGSAAGHHQSVDATSATDALSASGDSGVADAPAPDGSTSAGLLTVAHAPDLGAYQNQLAKGRQSAADRAARYAAARRPLFVLPAVGEFTSIFGVRWGVLHGGVDIANAIGTPIHAVEDGTVISAGPASGFGEWVRVQAADGTISVYGHIHEATVQVGQHVMAGDEIATMGARGNSTGPHLHFEVWVGGHRIDPLPWLAQRGISLGHYFG